MMSDWAAARLAEAIESLGMNIRDGMEIKATTTVVNNSTPDAIRLEAAAFLDKAVATFRLQQQSPVLTTDTENLIEALLEASAWLRKGGR